MKSRWGFKLMPFLRKVMRSGRTLTKAIDIEKSCECIEAFMAQDELFLEKVASNFVCKLCGRYYQLVDGFVELIEERTFEVDTSRLKNH